MKKVIVAILLVSVLAFFLLKCRSSGDEYDISVKYYYNPGCPHCRNFMPAWNSFANGKRGVEKIDCSQNPQLCSGVKGVPHVVFSDKLTNVVYTGNRTPEDLTSFFNFFSEKSKNGRMQYNSRMRNLGEERRNVIQQIENRYYSERGYPAPDIRTDSPAYGAPTPGGYGGHQQDFGSGQKARPDGPRMYAGYGPGGYRPIEGIHANHGKGK